MLIHRLSADWKDQSHSEMELKGGLNLLQSDGADWPGVLLASLFGLDGYQETLTRAEMTCQTPERTLTLSRSMDGDAPTFRATDDGGEAADLTAENCGEILTGVSAEVYANLAYITSDAAPDVRELQARLDQSQERVRELEERERSFKRELRDIENGQAASADGVPDLSVLTAAYAAMKSKLEEDRVPELDAISRLRGAIINIMTAGRQLDKAEAEQEAAERVLAAAKADVDAMPFSGMTPEEAEQSPLKLPFKPVIPKWLAIAFAALVALGALFLFWSPGIWYPVAWVLFVALGIAAGWLARKGQERWEVIAAERRERREADLVQYAELYRVMEEAQAAADIKISAADSLRESISTNERGILREIHRFAPEVSSMSEADEQLRLCARRRKELSIAEAVVRKAEALEGKTGAVPAISVIEQPDKRHVVLTNLPDASGGEDAEPGRGKLVQAINAARTERAALRLEIRRDKEELSEKSAKAAERVRLSLDTLRECENLGDEFPKALSVRIAEIFRALTDGQYDDATAGRVSLPLYGTDADAPSPFRLAVCLACFERVLSGDARPPLILQDPLQGFDERSRAASMRFFETMAEDRQILLFDDAARTDESGG